MDCLVCGNPHMTPLFDGTLLECEECSFVTANMRLGEEALRALYSDYLHTGQVFDYLGTRVSRQVNFSRMLDRVFGVIDETTFSNVLEIGCAYGFFGEVIHRRTGNRTTYTGMDIAGDAVDYGRSQLGLNLLNADYLTHPFDTPFSDIFLLDTIEHLADPDAFVCKAASELRPGGRIHIGTPDIKALLPRLRGKKWRNITPPSHLHYFSPKSLGHLLQRHGLNVIRTWHPPVYRNIRLIWYHLITRKASSAWAENVQRLIPKNLTLPINTFDNMLVMATKPENPSRK